jgi:hypothetical protein
MERVMETIYTPIENPGPLEARDLRDHPEWAQTHPWRLMGARDADKRQASMLADESRNMPAPKE